MNHFAILVAYRALVPVLKLKNHFLVEKRRGKRPLIIVKLSGHLYSIKWKRWNKVTERFE